MQNATAPSRTGSLAPPATVPANPHSFAGSPSLADASFAGLLATLTTPGTEPSWNDDQLAEDVATISYERALRNPAPTGRASSGPSTGPAGSKINTVRDGESETGSTGTAKPLRTSSITIRLSEPECAQLRRRAAEAGLTVSAYLRSCTLEVESLRSQVKETLAELRNSSSKPPAARAAPLAGHPPSLFATLRHRLRLIGRRNAPAPGLNAANPFAPVL